MDIERLQFVQMLVQTEAKQGAGVLDRWFRGGVFVGAVQVHPHHVVLDGIKYLIKVVWIFAKIKVQARLQSTLLDQSFKVIPTTSLNKSKCEKKRIKCFELVKNHPARIQTSINITKEKI